MIDTTIRNGLELRLPGLLAELTRGSPTVVRTG